MAEAESCVSYNSLPDADEGDILGESPNSLPAFLEIKKLSVSLPGTTIDRLISKFSKTREISSRVTILSDINAVIPPGCLVAILGTSGSGKTTLLNTLAGRIQDKTEGVAIRGSAVFKSANPGTPIPKKYQTSLLGYVLQHDHLLPNLTARETLKFAGLMKLPAQMSKSKKLKIVDKVLTELGLKDCADTRIGGDGKHPCISGGERRRVSIGIQMLTDPSILFLDEPTTGLDSFTANKLMATLSNIAHKSFRTVICTVHQPRSDIFQLFDYVMLLSKGKIVYYGESRARILNYFANLSFPCPRDMNPADYFLDLITVDTRSEAEEKASADRVNLLTSAYSKTDKTTLTNYEPPFSQGSSGNLFAIGNKKEIKRKMKGNNTKRFTTSLKASVLYQTYVIVQKLGLNTMRDRMLIVSKIIEPILMGLVVGFIFFQLGTSLVDIQSSIAALYSAVSLQPYLILLAIIVQYSQEFPVFDREYSDKMVGVFPYFAAQIFLSIPWAIVTPALFCIPYYYMINLRGGWEYFLWFYALIGAVQYAMECFGCLCCCLIREFGPSSLMANSTMTFWSLSCGFLINVATFPFYLTWISYTSPLLYAFSGLADNQFAGLEYPCPTANPDDPRCSLYNGNVVLESLHLHIEDKRVNIAVLFLMAFLFRVLSYFVLRFYKQPPK